MLQLFWTVLAQMSTHIVSTFVSAVLSCHDKHTQAHWAGWEFSPITASGKLGDAAQLLLHFRSLGTSASASTPAPAPAVSVLFHITSTAASENPDSDGCAVPVPVPVHGHGHGHGFHLYFDEAELRVALHVPAHTTVRECMTDFLAFLFS